MATTFQFIDHANTDTFASRRTIRSHGMKGRTVDKVRASRRSHPVDKSRQNLYNNNNNNAAGDGFTSQGEQAKICPKMLLQVGNELSGLASACEMTPQARVFVHDCTAPSPLYKASLCRWL